MTKQMLSLSVLLTLIPFGYFAWEDLIDGTLQFPEGRKLGLLILAFMTIVGFIYFVMLFVVTAVKNMIDYVKTPPAEPTPKTETSGGWQKSPVKSSTSVSLDPNATSAEAVHAATLQHLREQEKQNAIALQREARMKLGCFLLVAIALAIFMNQPASKERECYNRCLERKKSQENHGWHKLSDAQIESCRFKCYE